MGYFDSEPDKVGYYGLRAAPKQWKHFVVEVEGARVPMPHGWRSVTESLKVELF